MSSQLNYRVDKDADGRITETEIREVWQIGCAELDKSKADPTDSHLPH